MQSTPTNFLNSALEVATSPVELTRMLTDRYLRLEGPDRDMFTLALIMEIGAREALKQIRA